MPDEKIIYAQHAYQYDLLISREDVQGNILRTIRRIRSPVRLSVVDMGAGTGRLTCMLAPLSDSILALDRSRHMLKVATSKLRAAGLSNWQIAVADHRQIPARSHTIDLIVSGWSLCYLVIWGGRRWKNELDKALAEMHRVLKPGGTMLILETLGTGFEQPHRPKKLIPYFSYLERGGFSFTWFRTDYRFTSFEEAQELIGFFFGEKLARRVTRNKSAIIPECTGIWWLSV